MALPAPVNMTSQEIREWKEVRRHERHITEINEKHTDHLLELIMITPILDMSRGINKRKDDQLIIETRIHLLHHELHHEQRTQMTVSIRVTKMSLTAEAGRNHTTTGHEKRRRRIQLRLRLHIAMDHLLPATQMMKGYSFLREQLRQCLEVFSLHTRIDFLVHIGQVDIQAARLIHITLDLHLLENKTKFHRMLDIGLVDVPIREE